MPKKKVSRKKGSKSGQGRKALGARLLELGRDPIWQMIGTLIALVGLVWSFNTLFDTPGLAVYATPTIREPWESSVAVTEPASVSFSRDIYIVKWDGWKAPFSDALSLHHNSCVAPDNWSNSLGGYPAYYLILETRFGLTFVNPNELPNGIIEVNPIYTTDFDRQWRLRAWEVTVSKSDDFDNPIDPPFELPPNTPIKLFFRIRHIVDVHPGIPSANVYRYVESNLDPLQMSFETLPPSNGVSFEIGLDSNAYEAYDDGKYNFEVVCGESYSPWPLHMPGRALGIGE